MNAVIIDLSAYTILIFFACYTLFGFMGLLVSNPKRQNSLLKKQRLFLFATHLNCYVALLCDNPSTYIAILYVIELVFFFFVMKVYTFFYEDGSVLLINNMLMCLAIGFVILTRLDLVMAVKQVFIAAITSVLLLFMPMLVEKFKRMHIFTWVYAAIGFFGLLIVYAVGSITGGAKLSVSIGSYSFQPSELVKIIFVFFVASILTKSTEFKNIVIATAVAAAHVLLLVLSTDLGAALIFFITYLVMLFVATRQWWWLALGLVAGGGAAFIAYKLFAHVRVRITAWLKPLETIDNEGYQISQALFAISGGGWFGEGLSSGMPYKIPVVETDFVFAAITEELGTLFSVCLIMVCLTNLLMMINIAMRIRQRFYKYVALGLGTCYGFQVFLNIGGVTRLIPCTGVTLPLISYGGTSLVCTLVMFSLIQGMYVLDTKQKKAALRAKRREAALAMKLNKSQTQT